MGADAITMLTRAPVEGQVKTRLAADIGDERAVLVHAAMTLDLLEALAAGHVGPLVLALAGDPAARAAFTADARDVVPGLRVEEQAEGDLGERMAAALGARLAEGARSSLVVGSDCPEVLQCLPAVLAALAAGREAVLTPASDGGFVLLAVSRPLPPGCLLGLPWGTPRALEATVAALRDAGIDAALAGGPLDDIDDAAALDRLRRRLEAGGAGDIIGEPVRRAGRDGAAPARRSARLRNLRS